MGCLRHGILVIRWYCPTSFQRFLHFFSVSYADYALLASLFHRPNFEFGIAAMAGKLQKSTVRFLVASRCDHLHSPKAHRSLSRFAQNNLSFKNTTKAMGFEAIDR